MTKYILIQNDGEIETNSFELIGASTKRNQAGKIGFFGSGLKYSIAYMMRNGIGFRIFSGLNEVKFSTVQSSLKDQEFSRICINGNPTSFTTTMGPTWQEDWFVLREIYCNAVDETNCQLVRETEDVNPAEGKTRIYVELTPKLKTVCDKWDVYFSEDRTPLFEADRVYTCFLSSKDRGEREEETYYQKVYCYRKTDGVLYRRGINVHSNKNLLFDYGVDKVNINEDRTASSAAALPYMFGDLMGQFPSEDYVREVLNQGREENPSDEYMSLKATTFDQTPSQKWVEFSKENTLVVAEISGKFSDQIPSGKDVFLVPSLFAKSLKRYCVGVNILGLADSADNVFFSNVQATPKQEYLLKKVIEQLGEMGYPVPYPVSIVHFENEKILGYADRKKKKILISEKQFDAGQKEIALTLIEEVENINSGHDDKTRAFQTHLINLFLTSMENNSGVFL